MKLNCLSPANGSRPSGKRVGRGIGSGLGKTCGRGHKGQHARSGGFHKVGFEGGQMPLQRRLPKFGFTSILQRENAEVTLSEIAHLVGAIIDLAALKTADLIGQNIRRVKVIKSGEIKVAVTIRGINVTKGARLAIEECGGIIEV